MTRQEIEQLPRAEYFDGYLCPVCKNPMTAYCGRMGTIEEHKRVLGDELMGSDYLLLHIAGSACQNSSSVAGVADQQYLNEIEQSDFVLFSVREERLIPTSWRLIDGPVRGGDKYWNAAEGKWYPLTTNTFRDAADYVAVIRKGGE